MTNGKDERVKLHLLALFPLEIKDPDAPCVDRGEELLPAAQMAAESVNSNDFQDSFKLEIIPVQTTKCSDDSFSLTLTNFVQHLTNDSLTVIGAIGLICSSVLLSVTPFASRTEVGILQITSGTTSPNSFAQFKDPMLAAKLFQTAPPSTLFNDAVIALMSYNKWETLVLVRHSGVFFIEHELIATDLREKISLNENFSIDVSYDFELATSSTFKFDYIINTIFNSGSRIIYASVTLVEARTLLCKSVNGNQKLIAPRNQWIFHTHTMEELRKPIDNCTIQNMEKALEGVLLLQYSTKRNDTMSENLTLSNYTYSQYQSRYKKKLGNKTACTKKLGMIHANALYDSVIAFALAINNSWESVGKDQFVNYGIRYKNSTTVTKVMKENLKKQAFIGASGKVNFNNANTTHVDIEILMINNSGASSAFFYITSSRSISSSIDVINGSFPEIFNRIHEAFPITVMILVLALLTLHTTVLVLFVYYWNSPDIKATSPVLSIVILAACYMLDISIFLTSVRYGYTQGQLLAACCAVEKWFLFIGIQLIFATLLMRLVRVYRIFYKYTQLGKLWSDYSLLAFVMILVMVGVVVLIIWMVVDPPTTHKYIVFQASRIKPFFDISLSCRTIFFESFPVWIGILLVYSGIIMVLVVILAVKTRKVNIESFKDTSAINIFIYTTVIGFGILIVLSFLLDDVTNQVTVFICRVLSLTIVAVACICFLFLPKIYAAMFKKDVKRKSTVGSTLNGSIFVENNNFIMTSAL